VGFLVKMQFPLKKRCDVYDTKTNIHVNTAGNEKRISAIG
jgi:hypothetical protein